MATIKTFPQVIFVTVEEDGDNDWLLAGLTKSEALGDSGHAIVGSYRFVSAEDVRESLPTSKQRKDRKAK